MSTYMGVSFLDPFLFKYFFSIMSVPQMYVVLTYFNVAFFFVSVI